MKPGNLNSRERILKRVRKALSDSKIKIPNPEPDLNKYVFHSSREPLSTIFAKEFNNNKGRFIFCKSKEDLKKQLEQLIRAHRWKYVFCTEKSLLNMLKPLPFKFHKTLDDIAKAEVGISSCDAVIARTGSVILSSGSDKSRTVSIYPEIHIIIAFADQIFYDLEMAIKHIQDIYQGSMPSMLSINSGPSRTADIEKTLVLGAHGPKEVYCFYVNER
jgi:L-lactate dehydrogenase complex protein LldG